MSFGYLFTSFEGRIDRRTYWLGIVACLVITIVVSLVAGFMVAMIGFGALIVQIVLIVLIGYTATALMVKRLHDRERPNWIVAVFWAPTVLNLLGQLTGVGRLYIFPVWLWPNSFLGWIFLAASLVISIWALIELGFLRGTDGPNRYGPEPP